MVEIEIVGQRTVLVVPELVRLVVTKEGVRLAVVMGRSGGSTLPRTRIEATPTDGV